MPLKVCAAFGGVLVLSWSSVRLTVFRLHWETDWRLTVKFSVILESGGSQASTVELGIRHPVDSERPILTKSEVILKPVVWVPDLCRCAIGSRVRLLAWDHGLSFPLSAWEGVVDFKAGTDPRGTGNRLRKGDCRGSNWIHHLARGYQPYTL